MKWALSELLASSALKILVILDREAFQHHEARPQPRSLMTICLLPQNCEVCPRT